MANLFQRKFHPFNLIVFYIKIHSPWNKFRKLSNKQCNRNDPYITQCALSFLMIPAGVIKTHPMLIAAKLSLPKVKGWTSSCLFLFCLHVRWCSTQIHIRRAGDEEWIAIGSFRYQCLRILLSLITFVVDGHVTLHDCHYRWPEGDWLTDWLGAAGHQHLSPSIIPMAESEGDQLVWSGWSWDEWSSWVPLLLLLLATKQRQEKDSRRENATAVEKWWTVYWL